MRAAAEKYAEIGFADLLQGELVQNGVHRRKHQAAMKAAKAELQIGILQHGEVTDSLNCGKLRKLMQYIR